MELVRVDSIPEKKTGKDGRYANLVQEFLESDMELARVDFETHREAKSAIACLRYHVKRKPIDAYMRGNSIYLEKR